MYFFNILFNTFWYLYVKLIYNVDVIVILEHVLIPKNAMSPMGFDPGICLIVSQSSTNWAKGDLH
jgi:hypothetical protein